MAEEALVDHLHRGVNETLYERPYVLGIKTCDKFLENDRFPSAAVKTAEERGMELGESFAVTPVVVVL